MDSCETYLRIIRWFNIDDLKIDGFLAILNSYKSIDTSNFVEAINEMA